MKTRLTFLLTMFCITCFSQREFAPVGAEWYYTNPNYSYSPPSYPYIECIHFKSVKDTIINQESCKKIIVSYCSNDYKIGDLFLHQSNDSIFYFNNGEFYLLYDFSAKPGDTIVVHNEKFKPIAAFLSYEDSIANFEYKIIELDSVEINGDWYKRQQVSSPRSANWVFWGTPSYIIEKLGSTNYFFGRLVYTYPEQAKGMLRCYYDAQIDYKDDDWDMECDFLTANKQIILKNTVISLNPNPAKNIVTISNPLNIKIKKIEMIDFAGLAIQSWSELSQHENVLQIESLLPGMYLVKIETELGIETKKLIIQ